MSTERGYPLAVAILSIFLLAAGCAGSEPSRTAVLVGVHSATTQPTPTALSVTSPSTVVPFPGINPAGRPTLIVGGGTVVPPPEPALGAGQQAELTADPTPPTPVAFQTVAPVPTPTPDPTPILPPPATGTGVIIECIFFDGLVPRSEADEYVQILNQGATAVDLMGWRLRDVSDGSPELTFPSYDLQPQAWIRVYTDEYHPESGGFSFQRKSSIWNNSEPDTAGLIDPDGVSVSNKSYPPGC